MTDIAAVVRELEVFLLIALIVILVVRRLAIPYTLGLVVVGLLISISGLVPQERLTPDLVLFVFLPALLFEGSRTVEVQRLRANWVPIFLLAGPGSLLSLVLIAVPLHFFAGLAWGPAFLLGAILSPTDPVAVLGLLRQLKVDRELLTIIEGESLFNDGIAGSLYQIFLVFVLLSVQDQPASGFQAWLSGIGDFLIAYFRQVSTRLALRHFLERAARRALSGAGTSFASKCAIARCSGCCDLCRGALYTAGAGIQPACYFEAAALGGGIEHQLHLT